MGQSSWIYILVRKIKSIGDKAMLIETVNQGQFWLPLSQIAEVDQYNEGDTDLTLAITEWIAQQKDLEDES